MIKLIWLYIFRKWIQVNSIQLMCTLHVRILSVQEENFVSVPAGRSAPPQIGHPFGTFGLRASRKAKEKFREPSRQRYELTGKINTKRGTRPASQCLTVKISLHGKNPPSSWYGKIQDFLVLTIVIFFSSNEMEMEMEMEWIFLLWCMQKSL